MSKPKYSIEAPDQARLKRARAEIEAVMQKHDLAGVCILHTPGMTEWFYQLNPSYSRLFIDEAAMMARVRSRLFEDHGGDRAAHLPGKACPFWEEISLGLKLQAVFIADQDDRAFLDRCCHACLRGPPKRPGQNEVD